MNSEDKDWIKGMVIDKQYAKDIIKYIEEKEGHIIGRERLTEEMTALGEYLHERKLQTIEKQLVLLEYYKMLNAEVIRDWIDDTKTKT